MKRTSILALALSFLFLPFGLPGAYGQEVVLPLDDPVDPVDGAMVSTVHPQKGYADTVSLRRFVQLDTPLSDCTVRLVLDTTQTLRFRVFSFIYDAGTGPGSMGAPSSGARLDLQVYRENIVADSLVASPSWVLDGSPLAPAADTLSGGAITFVLTAGTYFLQYGGYYYSAQPERGGGAGREEGRPRDVIGLLENSSVAIALESLPLKSEDDLPGADLRYRANNTITSSTSLDGTLDHLRTSVAVFDDFGKATLTVDKKASPGGGDLLTLREYDGYGRAWRSWLPGVDPISNPAFADSLFHPSVPELSITSNADNEPYGAVRYEPSPLNRVTRESGPGALWHSAGKAVQTEWPSNIPGDALLGCLRIVPATSASSISLTVSGQYPAGTLQVTRTRDEDGRISLVFTDRDGQTVLERRVLSTATPIRTADTYHVHDGLGRLVAEIPPELAASLSTGAVSQTGVNKYAFLYLYDALGRPVGHKLPGCEWVYETPDPSGRIVLSRDGACDDAGITRFRLYDVFGRECVSGICSNTVTPGAVLDSVVTCTYAGPSGALLGYSVRGMTLADAVPLSATYYDSYAFLGDLDTGLAPLSAIQSPDTLAYCHGMVTGGATKILPSVADMSGAPSDWDTLSPLFSCIRYDSRGREILMAGDSHLGGTETETLAYDFVGDVVSRDLVHERGSQSMTEHYLYDYDRMSRPVRTRHSLGASDLVTIAENAYDPLGRVASSAQDTLTTRYAYNVRSQLTRIRNPFFSQDLHYTDSWGGAAALYGGDISSMEWRTGVPSSATARGYAFTYDRLGRLTEADYRELGMSSTRHDVGYAYDRNGNLTGLQRRGKLSSGGYGQIDNLTVTLDGNRPVRVDDASSATAASGVTAFTDRVSQTTEYTYDANGNLTSDLNRGISSVTYNLLNLPARISWSDGSTVSYRYDADGTLLREDRTIYIQTPSGPIKQIGRTAAYSGGVTYQLVIAGEPAERIDFEGGFITLPDGGYHFHVRDHLGSTRAVVSLSGTLERTLDYGPYGESLGTDWAATSAPAARKLFIGKEKLKSDDTELYDFGARRYDPALPRWTSVDPLAGKYPGLSPYSYCLADPVNALDPNGTHIYTFSSNGTWTKEQTEDDYDILVSVSGEQLIVINQDIMGNMQEDNYLISESDDLPYSEKPLHYSIFLASDPEALSVFKFLADNTTVEWLLYNGENGEALLGTNHQSGVVSEETLYTYVCTRSSIMESDPVWKIHNHPGETNNERESMLTDIDNTKGHTSLQSFVYISQSGNLYLIQNGRVKKNVQWGDILRLYQGR